MRDSNRAKLAATFEAEGVEILNGNAPGARLKPRAMVSRLPEAFVDAVAAHQRRYRGAMKSRSRYAEVMSPCGCN